MTERPNDLPLLKPQVNIWLEADGEVALSRWRVELLQAVERTGSISGAAEVMSIQYRLAWQRIQEMEERMGVSLVETTVGGKGGGGATLSDAAIRLIQRFTDMIIAIDHCVDEQSRLHLNKLMEDMR